MIEFTSLGDCTFSKDDQVVCALGFFDGVHRAHQTILDTCKQRARERNGKAVVFTFQNHPSEVVSPQYSVPLLMPYPLKKHWLSSVGMDGIVAVPFTEAFSRMLPEAFVSDVLINCLHAREIVVGFDFHYGYQRAGGVSDLQSRVPEHFDSVTVIERQQHDGEEISSTRIRDVVERGDLATAEAWLGHPYSIAGSVIRGDGRGRTIGFPTANLKYDKQLLLPNGVYGVRIHVDEIGSTPLMGVMNIGVLPTFKDTPKRTVEVHALDYDGDLYDRYLIAEVLLPIRGEQKFDGPAALVAQIQRDIETFRLSLKSR